MRAMALLGLAACLLRSGPDWALDKAAATDATPGVYDSYYGNYQLGSGHSIGINRLDAAPGETWILMSDYQAGTVHRLFPVSETEFQSGSGFGARSPPKLKLRFIKSSSGDVAGLLLITADGASSFADKVPFSKRDVTFADGEVSLSGTLLAPATKGPHPAIVLLHGSGPLTRWSFGPYPEFFTSLGLAVLIYDKRGTAGSTGTRISADTTVAGSGVPYPTDYYPAGLVDDALAAFHFLQSQGDIDPRAIGLWGSSEGGMLTTQVAAREHDVAFVIDASGFMGPLWQTVHYQVGTTERANRSTPPHVDEAVALADLEMNVARTGEGYETYVKMRQMAESEPRPWLLRAWILAYPYSSLEQMRWDWEHVLSFDPRIALRRVTCPVLGLWGDLDPLTDAADAARNMSDVLKESGNEDVTTTIFPNANHPLMVVPPGANPFTPSGTMAPDLFSTLRSWTLAKVRQQHARKGTPVGSQPVKMRLTHDKVKER